jgi:hypothetical protein
MQTLLFNGTSTYIEVPDSVDFSASTTGALTVAAWMRPDALQFPNEEGEGYVHWLGKGESGQQEWTFRMYGQDNTVGRANRISFYVFNLQGGLGVGSYVQEPVVAGTWIFIVGVLDGTNVLIYKDGVLKKSDSYAGKITPQHGDAPLRVGTRDFASFFLGSIREVRVWNRALSDSEVLALYGGSVPQDGLEAEFLLTNDIAPDTADSHTGVIVSSTWA